MRTENSEPSYWAPLPAPVRYDGDLSASAKILYAEIAALADKPGYCYAGNQYFAQLYQMSIRNVERLMTLLSKKGYIVIEKYRDELSGKVTERRIYAGLNPWSKRGDPPDKNVMTPTTKMSPVYDKNVAPSRQKCHDPHDKNVTQNKININNNPPISPQGGPCGDQDDRTRPKCKPERFEKFWAWYKAIPGEGGTKRCENRSRAVKAWDKLKPDDELITTIALALVKQTATPQWRRGIGIPQAATYLNQRRWEDAEDLPEPNEQKSAPSSGGWAPDEEVM